MIRKTVFLVCGTLVFSIVSLTFIVLLLIFTNANIDAEKTLFGVFGDTFGGILNPILTFITFIAVLAGLYLQQEELKATRDELSRSATAQEKNLEKIDTQISAQELIKFENTFFSFLNHHNQILKDLIEEPPRVDSNGGIRSTGSSAIGKTRFNIFWEGNNLSSARNHMVYKEKATDHYFRLVYQILKFIDINHPEKSDSIVFSKNQKKYSSILRASIPHDVLELIAINGASDLTTPSYMSYKLILEKSSFLEHLKFESNLIKDTLSIYHSNAFGKNIYIEKNITQN